MVSYILLLLLGRRRKIDVSTRANSVYQKRDRKVDILSWVKSQNEPEVYGEVI